jgi:hypothetical protein
MVKFPRVMGSPGITALVVPVAKAVLWIELPVSTSSRMITMVAWAGEATPSVTASARRAQEGHTHSQGSLQTQHGFFLRVIVGHRKQRTIENVGTPFY